MSSKSGKLSLFSRTESIAPSKKKKRKSEKMERRKKQKRNLSSLSFYLVFDCWRNFERLKMVA